MSKDWILNHLGMMVANRNAVLNHFQSIGMGVSVGPQPLLPHEEGEGECVSVSLSECSKNRLRGSVGESV